MSDWEKRIREEMHWLAWVYREGRYRFNDIHDKILEIIKREIKEAVEESLKDIYGGQFIIDEVLNKRNIS